MLGGRKVTSLRLMLRVPSPPLPLYSAFFNPEYYLLSFFYVGFIILMILLQVLPPPNVTGVLHIGHALTVAIEVSF